VRRVAQKLGLLGLAALAAACGGAGPGAKTPGGQRDLPSLVTAAMREEAKGDPARAIELWLGTLDAAVAAPDDP
jgi:hypothetical protein